MAVWYTGWAPALGQAPERCPGGCSVPPALEGPAAAAAGGSTRGGQRPDRWVGPVTGWGPSSQAPAGRGTESWGWPRGWHRVFWGRGRCSWPMTEERTFCLGRALQPRVLAGSRGLDEGPGFYLAAFSLLPVFRRALSGASLPYAPTSAPDYLGRSKLPGPSFTHGAPGEKRQSGQCPRGTAHRGGWRGPQ